jgi:hypothetical protein
VSNAISRLRILHHYYIGGMSYSSSDARVTRHRDGCAARRECLRGRVSTETPACLGKSLRGEASRVWR